MAPERSKKIASKTISASKHSMNNKASYELIITSKLESIPVPDLSDAIWARIEAQLDDDFPTDDSGGDSPAPGGPALTRKILTGMGMMTATVALISVFYFTNEPGNPSTNAEPVTKSIEIPEQIPAKSNAQVEKPISVLKPISSSKAASLPPASPEPDRVTGTGIQSGITLTDSASVGRPVIKAPPFAFPNLKPVDTIPGRSRGVSGISDDDYKIEPKRNDSSN